MKQEKYTVTPKIVEFIVDAYKKTGSAKEVKQVLQTLTGWGRTKVAETVNKIVNTLPEQVEEKDYSVDYKSALAEMVKEEKAMQDLETIGKPEKFVEHLKAKNDGARAVVKDLVTALPDAQLEVTDNYTYNRATDQYIVPNKKTKSGFVVLHGNIVRAIRDEYTANATSNDIAAKHSIPKECVAELLQRLGITHDAHPITDEELAKSDATLIAEGVEKRKFDISQAIEKEVWKDTQKDALEYRRIKHNALDVFESYLKNWNPPKYVPVKGPTHSVLREQRALIIGAYDWHIGGVAEDESILKGRDWDIEEAKKSVIKYMAQLEKHIAFNAPYSKAVLVMGGDLFHTLTGFTASGTLINGCDKTNETQFNAVSECLVYFIESVLNMFPNVEVHFVKGNHGGLYDYLLGSQLKAYFRTEKRLVFNNYQARHATFMVGDVYVIAEHGAAADQKHKVPSDGSARSAYIQNLILADAEKSAKAKQRLFMMGDLHHTKYKDEGSHIFFQSGALPCGDRYASTQGKFSRPTQTCISVDGGGISGFHHFYFD